LGDISRQTERIGNPLKKENLDNHPPRNLFFWIKFICGGRIEKIIFLLALKKLFNRKKLESPRMLDHRPRWMMDFVFDG
jgi:hypothetical protein